MLKLILDSSCIKQSLIKERKIIGISRSAKTPLAFRVYDKNKNFEYTIEFKQNK